MSSLERVESGSFSLSSSHTLEEIEAHASCGALSQLLLPVESLFLSLPEVRLSGFYTKLFTNGQPIYSSRAMIALPEVGTLMRVYDHHGRFFALGEVLLSDSEPSVKSVKLFL